MTDSVPLQVTLIIFCSFVITMAAYEFIRRIPGIRLLFGIAGKKKAPKQDIKVVLESGYKEKRSRPFPT